MISDWVSFLAYTNLFGIKGFVVVCGGVVFFHLVNCCELMLNANSNQLGS
jgi:hypothetical protein